ncbi:MAG: carbohydrate kinase family protein [Patescibacteria group bacterium]|nr:carbohydrate kinase family protein [Patescibacteria group bacterium]
MKKFDLITVGDTTLDVFLELVEEVKVIKDKTTGLDYLGLVNAEKIPVKKLTIVPAVGNSANVAIGAARLGLKSAIYTILGEDQTGSDSLEVLKKEGVALDYITIDKKQGSNFSAVLNYKAERTILVYHEKRTYSLPKLPPASFMYFSSLAKGHEKLHSQIPKYVKANNVKLGFNPGSYQLREGLKRMIPILKVAEVLFVNRAEAQTLVGKEPNIKKLLTKLHKQGPKIVVITEGPKGSYASDGEHVYFLDIFPAPLVERTGAGDAFSTGFISALAKGESVPDAMRWGTISSASVIQYIGAREGLLSKKVMQATIKKSPKFQPKEL